ncbi:MAG TPA: glycosyltransferase family 2 protein [Gaiellaceae bacterium]|nr:glycosyltransferase family 2 protein [Gaiellaceae bacterium]
MSIAVVVLTFNRPHLLEQCLEKVVRRTSDRTTEILLVDNGSTDGTSETIARFCDPRVRVIRNRRNIGQSAYRPAFARTTAEYLIELDDDVIDAPEAWDRTLLDAFERLPEVGFLAANLVDEPNDVTARIMYGHSASAYRFEERNGVQLKLGPVGGWCAITSRAIYDEVGGFRRSRHTFWLEDAAYIKDIRARGYEAAILDDLRVAHAGGEFFAPVSSAKERYWQSFRRRNRRRRAAKRLLLALPPIRSLNARHGWFRAP